MAKSISTFLGELAQKAGLAVDNVHLINVISNADLSKVTIPDELSSAIDAGVISIASAADNHPTIGAKYKAQALNAMDAKIKEVLDAIDLPEDKKGEIVGITSTFKRFEALITALQEVSKKPGVNPKADEAQKALIAQNEALNNELKLAKENADKIVANHATEIQTIQLNYTLGAKLAGLKTVLDSLPASAKDTTIKTLINNELASKGYKFVTDANGNLELQTLEGAKPHNEKNTLVTVDDFINGVLANNKVLAVSEPTPPVPPTPPVNTPPGLPGNPPIDPMGNNQNAIVNDFNAQALAALEASM